MDLYLRYIDRYIDAGTRFLTIKGYCVLLVLRVEAVSTLPKSDTAYVAPHFVFYAFPETGK